MVDSYSLIVQASDDGGAHTTETLIKVKVIYLNGNSIHCRGGYRNFQRGGQNFFKRGGAKIF